MYNSKAQLVPGAQEGLLKGSRNDGILSGRLRIVGLVFSIPIDESYLLTQIELDTCLDLLNYLV